MCGGLSPRVLLLTEAEPTHYFESMRTIARTFVALLFASGSFAFGALPQLDVTVVDSGGKSAYKGATNAKGTFATGTLKPGKYVVQFTAKAADVKTGTYSLVVSAGSKKVSADSVAGSKLAAGVAMKIDVGSGTNITGLITTGGLQAKVDENGKKMVWIPKRLGSNLPGHWAPADSAEAKELESSTQMNSKTLQQNQNPGADVTRPRG
jgi:hypothetical protein